MNERKKKTKNNLRALTSSLARTSLLPRHGLSPCTCTLLRNISCRFWKVVSTPPETTAGHESRSPGFADAARTFDQVADADGAAPVVGRGGSVFFFFWAREGLFFWSVFCFRLSFFNVGISMRERRSGRAEEGASAEERDAEGELV